MFNKTFPDSQKNMIFGRTDELGKAELSFDHAKNAILKMNIVHFGHIRVYVASRRLIWISANIYVVHALEYQSIENAFSPLMKNNCVTIFELSRYLT